MTFDPRLKIRIGTMVGGDHSAGRYIRQILPHGFESFQLHYWRTIGKVDLKRLARETTDALAGSGAVISSLGVYGNPLESTPTDKQTLNDWKRAIDHVHLFGAKLVCGFTGRIRGKSIPDSIPRFKKVFGELAKRASDQGVKIAFENCEMGGNWDRGDWNIAHNPSAWELMFDAVPNKALGLEWEPAHQLGQLIDPLPQLRQWAKKVHHVHGKDSTVKKDVIAKQGIHGPKQWAFDRHPGFGDSNWTDIVSELRQQGYAGSIDIEGWHDPVYRNELEMTGQVAALNYLKRCRGGDYADNPS